MMADEDNKDDGEMNPDAADALFDEETSDDEEGAEGDEKFDEFGNEIDE